MDRQPQESSLFERLRAWLASSGQEAQPASRDVAEEIHKLLPEELSARSGIEEDRRRKAMLEEIARNAR